jgi:hypothetical protein
MCMCMRMQVKASPPVKADVKPVKVDAKKVLGGKAPAAKLLSPEEEKARIDREIAEAEDALAADLFGVAPTKKDAGAKASSSSSAAAEAPVRRGADDFFDDEDDYYDEEEEEEEEEEQPTQAARGKGKKVGTVLEDVSFPSAVEAAKFGEDLAAIIKLKTVCAVL